MKGKCLTVRKWVGNFENKVRNTFVLLKFSFAMDVLIIMKVFCHFEGVHCSGNKNYQFMQQKEIIVVLYSIES